MIFLKPGLASSGTVHKISIFAKAGTNNYFGIGGNNALGSIAVNLSDGTIIRCSGEVQSVGNGWFRIVTDVVYGGGQGPYFGATDAFGTTIDPATGTETVYVWGAQAEDINSVTAYTPTTTQAITNYIPVLQTAASGAARFDHDPITSESLGLLIEEQRTNQVTYSEDLNSWNVSTSPIVINNIAIAPDGTLSATSVDVTGGYIYNNSGSHTGSQTYTWSLFIKSNGGSNFRIEIDDSGFAGDRYATIFDYSTEIASIGSSGVSRMQHTKVEQYANGWYRLSQTFTTRATAGSFVFMIRTFTGPSLVWGAQMELGSFATSYIKTTGSQVTRSADLAVMTGTNFTDWYNISEGTLYGEGIGIDTDRTNAAIFEIASGGVGSYAGNALDVRTHNNGTVRITANSNTIVQASFIITNTDTFRKMALGYATNNFAGATKGIVQTDTSGVVPQGLTTVMIGSNHYSVAGWFCGWIPKISYYPKRLTDAELQDLTEI